MDKHMAAGTIDDPIDIQTLNGFEGVPDHWYRFKGKTFKQVGPNQFVDSTGKELRRKRPTTALTRKEKDRIYRDLGLKKVRGALGGIYYE